MSNTLAYIQKAAFSAAQEVVAESSGYIQAVNTTFDDKGVAKGEYVDVPVAPVATEDDFAPGVANPTPTDQTAGRVRVQIAYSKKTVPRALTGEEIRSLQNADTDKEWARQNLMQDMRTLRNGMEARLALCVKAGASRATGTAGTAPFASDLSALTAARKILTDNGAPGSDLQCIVNSDSYLNLTNLGIIQQAAMAGSDAERRSGIVGRQFGFQIRQSAGIVAHTIGTPSGTLCSASQAVGDVSIAYDGDTNGPWTAGDVVTFGSGGGSGTADANKYIVSTANSATPLLINKPGLRVLHVDNDTMTVGAAYTPNSCFERNAIILVARPPAIPQSPVITQMPITDPISGLTFLLLEIVEYGQIVWELHLAYGFAVVQPELTCTILG